jgi:hypothetical protein
MLQRLRKTAQVLEWTLAAMLPTLAWLRNVDSDQSTGPILRLFLESIRDHQLGVAAFLGIGVFLSKSAQSLLDRYVSNSKALKALLESAHKVYFREFPSDDSYAHRVSLFEARRRWRDLPQALFLLVRQHRWHWKQTLVLTCRSGTAYQFTATELQIDDEEEAVNQGVAGRAWFTNAAATVSDLPEWAGDGEPGADLVRRTYAERGFLTVEKAAAVKVKSRSLGAHVVRTRTGDRWGVIVFDSRHPAGISDDLAKKNIMELSAHLLSQLL